MEILAPAKVNLSLFVKRKRHDGYHELETIMQKIDLADRLVLEKCDSGVSIKCGWGKFKTDNSAVLPEDDTNLACLAAKAFFSHSKIVGGVKITLDKNIPIAAGLGGGSSDAAAVLRGLNKMYPPGLDLEALLEIAVGLGADVPFFVSNESAAFATGIGDCLESIPPLQNCWILLVNPGFAVSTKWVFDNFALTSGDNPYILGPDLETCSRWQSFSAMVGGLQVLNAGRFENDLERVTLQKYSQLVDIKKSLDGAGALFSLMSGSGPTIFGIFQDVLIAQEAFQSFRKQYADVFLCRPM